MSDTYSELDGLGLADLVRSGQTTAAELLDTAIGRAEKVQAELNCFSALYPGLAREQLKEGVPDGPYSGVPFVVKDLGVEVKGAPVTSGSRAFKGNIASRDSTLVDRFRKSGVVFFGTTTSPEFGLTLTTESTLYGQTRNPWDTTRTTGGSSGGAAAAVASGVLPVAHASDGGGSIRIPAACCGLVGLKPSRGRMPMGPAKTEGWNGLSTVGVVSRTVRDTAAMLDLTHGPETGSRYGAPSPARAYLSELDRDPRPLRIALWPTAPNGTQPDADAAAGLANTAKLLESLGHTIVEAGPKIDGEALAKAGLFVISANIAALVEERGAARGTPVSDDELEPITASMVRLGRTVPMMEFAKANNAFITAAIIYEHFMDAGQFDMTLSPTLHRAPDLLGTMALTAPGEQMGAAVAGFAPHCAMFNQTGCPAITLPLHWTAPAPTAPQGLPIGMMFGARYGREDLLLSLAGQLERAAPWAHRKPPVWAG